MSLPTPPSTAHRGKENRASISRVVWSQKNQYHNLASPPTYPRITSASKDLPRRSILKKRTHALLSVQPDDQREVTPEPSDPLVNLDYLTYPVSRIIALGASLRDLIEAYNVLAARLRACVSSATDVDASWPLFQPLRKHADVFVAAIVRDLERALIDPEIIEFDQDESKREDVVLLPSPMKSPRKKKGMSAEQVKYARDLCTTCHSVIKLLAVVFSLPAVSKIFTDQQLCTIMNQVLAIPMASELPTPNARKTCALAIWLLQVQRLSPEVLGPTSGRIASALRRGMDGKLGKEGKKGSASDGLKAIHDLCVYQPSTFVFPFTELLPSILSNLLAPTLTLRSQACHALGGFVIACTSLPLSYIHTRISSSVATFLATTLPATQKSPTKSQDSAIVRTLRTTLAATEPQHVAQGPVWALSVLASFVVLLGPRLCTDTKLTRTVSALLALSMRHKKSSIRALGCVMWRCVSWVYFQPPLLADPDEESEVDQDRDIIENQRKRETGRENYWKLVKSVVELHAGIATIAGLLSTEENTDDCLRRALSILNIMIHKGGQTCADAVDAVRRLVSFEALESDWDWHKLLPHSLFSSSPGLLTVEFKSLVHVVRPIFEQTPTIEDIRSLTREEITKDWVFDELVNIWKVGLTCLEIHDDTETPNEIIAVWDGLLKANIGLLQDAGDNDGTSEFAVRAADILIDILQDANLELTPKPGPNHKPDPTNPLNIFDDFQPHVEEPISAPSGLLKLRVIRELWAATRTTIPHAQLAAAGERLLACLMKNEEDLTDFGERARILWAGFCVEVLVVCDTDALRAFWGYDLGAGEKNWEWGWTQAIRSQMWRTFVDKWKGDGEGTWEGAVVLLSVPFTDANNWDLSGDDYTAWEEFLGHSIGKALDYGVDSITVLDNVASSISQNQNPTFTSSARVADLLMSHLDMADAREIPASVIEFVDETLRSTYPPEPRNKPTSLWMIRSLVRVIEACPIELFLNLLEVVQEGLCIWISDEYQAWSQDEYAYDIVCLYEMLLATIRTLPHTFETFESVSPILESIFCGRPDKPTAISEAFVEFWHTTYASMQTPQDGWPVKIQHALGIYSNVSVDDPEEDIEPAEVNKEASETGKGCILNTSITSSPMKTAAPSPFIGVLGPAFFASYTPTSRSSTPEPHHSTSLEPFLQPSTPKTPVASTPPSRPHKPSMDFDSFPLHSPKSPITTSQRRLVTPKRTPLGRPRNVSGEPSISLSHKRRKVEDKENECLNQDITSPAECTDLRVPDPLTLSKRRRADDREDEDRPLKRCRLNMEPTLSLAHSSPIVSDDSEDEEYVEFSLIPVKFPASDLPSDLIQSTSKASRSSVSPKKRQRIFMDAIEVPSVQEVYRRSKRLQKVEPAVFSFMTPSANRTLRQTRSSSRLLSLAKPTAISKENRSKRRRNSDCGDAFLSSSPIRALRIIGSDDSIILAKDAPKELSSDDDPHLGQVTPHHLISPALRHARSAVAEVGGSDDSTMPASPTRDVVSRRSLRLSRLVGI